MSDADYEVWTAMMEDAIDAGDVRVVEATTISGYVIPATYWVQGREPHPHMQARFAQMALANVCACRGSLHYECVYPTLMRGEEVLPMEASRVPNG